MRKHAKRNRALQLEPLNLALLSMRPGRFSIVLFGIAVWLSNPPANLAAQNSSGFPNVIGVELLGRAGIYSINYERSLPLRTSVGAGMAWWSDLDENALILPLYASINPVGNRHSVYLGAGTTFVISNVNLFGPAGKYGAGAFGTLTAGYQYRSAGGFLIRPTVNLLYRPGSGVLPWPGLTIGRTF